MDGEKSNYKTDENGRVRIKFGKARDYNITDERYVGEFIDIFKLYAKGKVFNSEEIRKKLINSIKDTETNLIKGKIISSKLNLERYIEDVKNILVKDSSGKYELEEALRKLRKDIDNLINVSNLSGGSS